MKKEKSLVEMISNNFIEITKEGQHDINGGKLLKNDNTSISLYAVRPKDDVFGALNDVNPIDNSRWKICLYAVRPKLSGK